MRSRAPAVGGEVLHTGVLAAAGVLFGLLVFDGDARWLAAALCSVGMNGALPWGAGMGRLAGRSVALVTMWALVLGLFVLEPGDDGMPTKPWAVGLSAFYLTGVAAAAFSAWALMHAVLRPVGRWVVESWRNTG